MKAIPIPILKVLYISFSSIFPIDCISLKIGCIGQESLIIFAPSPFGKTRGMFSTRPPPNTTTSGANNSTTDIINTQEKGTVKSAGFNLSGSRAATKTGGAGCVGHVGTVQFIAADHAIQTNERGDS